MARKLKKLTLQYEYLKLEKEEVDEICKSIEPEIREFLRKHYPEHYAIFYENEDPPDSDSTKMESPPQPNLEEDISDNFDNLEHQTSSSPKNPDLKKLFRKIVEKTHPDKVGDNRYADLFAEAVDSYNQDDIGKLLTLASQLNIELTKLSIESLTLLNNNIQNLFSEIQRKKNTTGWAWSQTKSDEEKKQLIQTILMHKGVSL
jgi:hypothetical protein